MSSSLPNSAIPTPLPNDGDDVSWALQTAAVQWGRGAYQDAIVWLRRAADSAIDLEAWSRGADLNAAAVRLEKQLNSLPTKPPVPMPSAVPSAPLRNAILPSFPVPATTAPPPASTGLPAGARRQTTGYSSLPPLPKPNPFGVGPSQPASGRSSVVIDVEEVEDAELELSDDEIKELESSDVTTSDIPNGARPSWGPPSSNRGTVPALPAYPLESSRPPPSMTPSRRLPAVPSGRSQPAQGTPTVAVPPLPLESSGPPTATVQSDGPTMPGRVMARGFGSAAPSGANLPSFPLEAQSSTVPPVSKWPRVGSPGTSHLPPTPGLPAFESVPPSSRPYAEEVEDDDGAPGLDIHVLDDEAIAQIERHSRKPRPAQLASPRPQAHQPSEPPLLELERSEFGHEEVATTKIDRRLIESAVAARSGRPATGLLGRLPNQPLRPSSRAPAPPASLPPALPAERDSVRARDEQSPPRDPRSVPTSSGPSRVPARESSEPRMPPRRFAQAAPLDFKSSSERTAARVSESASMRSSSAPTLDRIQAAEPASVAPPISARSIEPEDLPTVSSPSLSRPPPSGSAQELAPSPSEVSDSSPSVTINEPERDSLSVRLSEARVSDARGISLGSDDRRRISFRFEERTDVPPSGMAPSEPPESSLQASSSPLPAILAPLPPYPVAGEPAAGPADLAGDVEVPVDAGEPMPDGAMAVGATADLPVVPPEPVPEEPLASLPPVVSRPNPDAKVADAEEVLLAGVRLADVRGFGDLPASAHHQLVKTATIETLASGEEVSFFSVALVLDGWVGLMPAIADTACATAIVGEVVFTEGTLAEGLMLRVVAGQDNVKVATWDTAAVVEATRECPWVADDLRLLADGFQALAGACLGPLGDRLDDSLRSIVTSRCEIRTLLPGEQLCASGKPVPGMHIIGGGDIELVDADGNTVKTHGTGEFLFAAQVLAGGVVPYAARAGKKGALVLFAPRMAAHELLVSVPPLLEILAE